MLTHYEKMFLRVADNYEVCENGDVRNIKTKRLLKSFKVGKYLGVHLGAKNKHYIHHLVAQIFLPAPTSDDCVIDHINRNPYDNCATNLRWVSRSENSLNRTVEIKARSTSLTGEHHISLDKWNRYVVRLVIKKQVHYKYCETLEEAKYFRNTLLENEGW